MFKFKHYKRVGIEPILTAEICSHKGYVCLTVSNPRNHEVLFNKACSNEDEAFDILTGFGHGYEYLGVKWLEVD